MAALFPLRAALGRPTRSSLPSLALEGMVALAQGGLAVVLGALARALGGSQPSAADAPAMTWMSRVWSNLPRGLGIDFDMGRSRWAVGMASVGLFLVMMRSVAAVTLMRREVLDAARLATHARGMLLRAALLGGASATVSIGGVVTWPAEIEAGARAERGRARAVVHLVVLAVVTVAIDATLAAVLLAVLAPFALLLSPIRRALRRAQSRAAHEAIEMVDACRDLVEHAPLWATCGGGPTAAKRVELASAEGARSHARAAVGQALSSSSNEVMAGLAVLVLVAVFAPGAPFGRATLVPVLVALVSAYRPLRELADAGAAVDRGLRALEHVTSLRAAPNETHRVFGPAPLVARRLAIDVGCARVREGLDLEIRPGEVLALIGAPGTGKSAFLEAIAGVRNMRGVLAYGGEDLTAAAIGPTARPIAWVPPSPPVLPGTLAENLAPDAPTDRARIRRARAVLDALGDERLLALDDDALLGPRGVRPSSGEAQRLALARAIASPSPVLLLDEPTANLDAGGEARAIQVLRRECAHRITLLVTHRPAPLALASAIVDLSPSESEAQPAAGSRDDVVRAPESERRIA